MKEAKKEPLKLHLGCGERYLVGYLNIDYPPDKHTIMTPKADVFLDLRQLDYPENSIAEIRHHHVFEHFSRTEALRLLLRWRRWLIPGGLLRLETPDFEGAIKKFLRVSFRHQLALGRHIFGSQEALWAKHLDFWYKDKFKYVLTLLGFKVIKVHRYNNSLAKKYPRLRTVFNLLGDFLPNMFYKKFGGHQLPNIEVFAKKTNQPVKEEEAIKSILGNYLVGRESKELLEVWLKEK